MAGTENNARKLSELYREVILSHAVKPVGHEVSIDVTHRAERNNPLCGDHIVVSLQVEDNLVRAATFSGEACAICTASASLLCEHVGGLQSDAIQAALTGFAEGLDANGLPVDENHPCPDYLAPMLGVRDFPARVACATLPWETAIAALKTGEV